MQFDENSPIFVQLAAMLEDGIVSGAYPEESQVPSTPELAVGYKINPATALKGVNLLVEKGLLYKKRGLGMYVAAGAREKLMAERHERFREKYLEPLLRSHRFDAIVATHTFPAQTLTKMKREGKTLPPTFFIATDYTCTPFEEESDCDYTVIPSPELRDEFCRYGFDGSRILSFGIPVRAEFAAEESRAEARRKLGWEENQFVMLLSGGSIGAGKIAASIAALRPFLAEDETRRLIVICGNNRRLYERLRKQCAGCGRITVLERTEQMADFMHGCDVFISKPGGLSSTEAAAAGVPLIHISPIPGCETRNFRFFADHGMSIPVRSPRRELRKAVETLCSPAAADAMRQAQRDNLDRFSTARLCDLIEHTAGSSHE